MFIISVKIPFTLVHSLMFVCLSIAYCQSDSDCQLNEQCMLGQCRSPCEQPSACGMNAECHVSGHMKHCSCPVGFTGNNLVECVRSMSFLLK